MAMFPCDVGPHRHRGRNYNIYVARGSGADFTRYMSRLCGEHFAFVQQDLAKYKVGAEDTAFSADSGLTDCLSCGEPAVELWQQLFLTCYPTDNQREDYWARIHFGCPTPELLLYTHKV